MAIGETARLIASLELDPRKFNAGVGSALGKLGKLESGVGRMGKGLGQVGSGLARSGAIIGTAVVGGIAAAAKVGADFEAQLNTINTIARATPEGLNAIGDAIRGIARDTGKPLDELTQGYYDLLSAGIQAKDATNVLTQANTLAIGGLASTAETVDLLTTAINVYGGDASKAAEFTDDFATAIERGKVTAADLAASYATVAPLANSLGIENAELAAGYATLTAAGTAAGEASTQMASAMTALLKTTPGLEKLQKATGKNYAAIAGKKGLNVALEAMRNDAEKAGIELIDLVGRKEALLYILQTTGPNLAAYNADLAAMATNAGTAAEQMSERQKGLAFEIGRLRANFKDAAIELAAGFLPALSRSASKLTEFLNTDVNRAQLRAIGEDIGRAIDKIDWGAVLQGAKEFWGILKGAAGVALTILETLNKLPTEIKAAGLGLIGLNKLSGGLVATGIGNIVGGLAETVARSVGSLLPGAAGRAFVQPVLVTNWPPTLGGGAGGAGAKGSGVVGAAGGLVAGAVVVQGVLDAATIAQGFGQAYQAHQAGDMQGILDAQKQTFAAVTLLPPGVKGLGDLFAMFAQKEIDALGTKVEEPIRVLTDHQDALRTAMIPALMSVRDRAEANRIATVTGTKATTDGLAALRAKAEANRIATVTGTSRTIGAIQANRPIVKVNVETNVRVNQTTIRKSYTTSSQVGRTSGPTETDH